MLRHYLREWIPYPCTRCERLPTCAQVPRGPLPPAFCDALPPRRMRSSGVKRARRVIVPAQVERPEWAAAEQAPSLVGIADASGAIEYLNTHWTRLTGQMPPDYLGLGWLDALHPEDRSPVLRQLRGLDAPPVPGRIGYRVRTTEGGWHLVEGQITPRYSAAGDFLGFFGVASGNS